MVNSYHLFFGEEHGTETFPTHYFWWKQDRPFYIDYFFIPQMWAPQLRQVSVGGYEDWKHWSNHRLLVVGIDIEGMVA
jgi:exodeoxyribonuclease III